MRSRGTTPAVPSQSPSPPSHPPGAPGPAEGASRPILRFPAAAEMAGTGPADGRVPAPHDPDEVELMRRVRWGDVAAFEQIVERYWERTLVYARHLLGDRDRAYDIAQEAFARLWLKKDEWTPTGSVRVWLLRTARNLVISEQRKWNVRRRWALTVRREDAPQPRTPLQEAEGAELRAAIQQALAQLSPRRREVFTLFHLQNLSYREIAEIMNIRPQTVANYLQAAVAELRVELAVFFPALSARPAPPGPPVSPGGGAAEGAE